MQISKHKPGILGAFLLVPAVARAGWEIVGLAGNIDFIVTHVQDLGWMGSVMSWIINMPPGAYLLLISAGLALIWWDVKGPYPWRSSRPSASDQGNGPLADGSAKIMLEMVHQAPPTVFPPSGEIYGFDFHPQTIFSGPRRGEPGSPVRWGVRMKDGFEIHDPKEAMRITLVSDQPIHQVSFTIKATYRNTVRHSNGNVGSGDEIVGEQDFVFSLARLMPEQSIDLWLYTQAFDTVFLDLPKENITYADPNSGSRLKARLVFQPYYGMAVPLSATPPTSAVI